MRSIIVKVLCVLALFCVFSHSPTNVFANGFDFEIGDTGICFNSPGFWKSASCDIPGAKRIVSPSGKTDIFYFALSGDADYAKTVGKIRSIQRERSLDDSFVEELSIRKSSISDLYVRDVRFSRPGNDETPYFHGIILGSGPEPFRPIALIVISTENAIFADSAEVFSEMEQSFYRKAEFEERFSHARRMGRFLCRTRFEERLSHALRNATQFEIGDSGISFSVPETWKSASCDIPEAEKIVSPSGNIEVFHFAFHDPAGYTRAINAIKGIQRRIAPDKKIFVQETPARNEFVDALSVKRICFRGPNCEENPYFCGFLFNEFPGWTHPIALIVFVTNHERRLDNWETFWKIENSFHSVKRGIFRNQTGNI